MLILYSSRTVPPARIYPTFLSVSEVLILSMKTGPSASAKTFMAVANLPAALSSARVILLLVPVAIIIILYFSYRLSNRLAGPIGRLYKELDKRVTENSKEHIIFRDGDDLSDLADKINAILDKLP